MLMSTMQIATLDAREMTDDEALAIGKLLAATWQNPEKPASVRAKKLLEIGANYHGPDKQGPRSFVVREHGQVIAHAAILPRTIGTDAGSMTIAGLASVCTDPAQRGRGLGEVIAKAAFEPVDTGLFPFSLFQTSEKVRPFYERLGAVVVENKIVNSLAEDPTAFPFWDSVIMRYPGNKDWPKGEIDLRGPGY